MCRSRDSLCDSSGICDRPLHLLLRSGGSPALHKMDVDRDDRFFRRRAGAVGGRRCDHVLRVNTIPDRESMVSKAVGKIKSVLVQGLIITPGEQRDPRFGMLPVLHHVWVDLHSGQSSVPGQAFAIADTPNEKRAKSAQLERRFGCSPRSSCTAPRWASRCFPPLPNLILRRPATKNAS